MAYEPETGEKSKIQDPRNFFIIYKRDSAGDLARHVHKALHDRGVDAFLDQEDLEEGLTAPDWRKQRDDALEASDVFIFILTHDANTSGEVLHELKKALEKEGSVVRVFIDSALWNVNEQLIFEINGQEINVKDHQCKKFDSESWEGLVRIIANTTLITKIIEPT